MCCPENARQKKDKANQHPKYIKLEEVSSSPVEQYTVKLFIFYVVAFLAAPQTLKKMASQQPIAL